MEHISRQISGELGVRTEQVSAAVRLLDEGATVPFIARYRKEATGSLNDSQLRTLEERLGYLRSLEERRETILNTIKEQGKLTPETEQAIRNAASKVVLEDLYLPFKPKRQTRGQKAIEAGLEPLAEALYENPALIPEQEAERFINEEKQINDVATALQGALHILAERFSEAAGLNGRIREHMWHNGVLCSTVRPDKEKAANAKKFRDYFNYNESLKKIPSHRALAVFRGRKEGVLQTSLRSGRTTNEQDVTHNPYLEMIGEHWSISHQGRPGDDWMADVVRKTWQLKLQPRMETDLTTRLRENAEKEAVRVFAANLKDLLLAAPAGRKVTMGLDPGLRTGVKVAVVDQTGKLVDHTTVFPHEPQNRITDARGQLVKLMLKHGVELIATGNGTASRETDRFITELLKQFPKLQVQKAVVSEAGASVYSASKIASEELPDLDVTIRGAVSIARRLQDPLAELVKIEPASIGVGQYQHDVRQSGLTHSLDCVVEDCVNLVGVDLNTASPSLLSRVAGLNRTLADNIVTYRNTHGPFACRKTLLSVERMGEKSFEQSAGFLRIRGGENPLDASGVHPESYPLAERIARSCSVEVRQLTGNTELLSSLHAQDFAGEQFGLPTVTDVLKELQKPGRDPRPEFKCAAFREGVEDIRDLKPGMQLEGVVTNVTNFGAFVDIGVHQDGLVHISSLCDRFVKDPRDIVKAGDVVRVKVVEADVARKRITLTMRDEANRPARMRKNAPDKSSQRTSANARHPGTGTVRRRPPGRNSGPARAKPERKPEKTQGTFAELFANARKLRK